MIEFKYPNHEPAADVFLDGREHTLTWDNTEVTCHRERWSVFDHLYIIGDVPNVHLPRLVFRENIDNFDELANSLIARDYIFHRFPWPHDFDVEEYMRQQTVDLGDIEAKLDSL
jgi:chromosome condensin MukBEF complex kleisin-like MukF subunit